MEFSETQKIFLCDLDKLRDLCGNRHDVGLTRWLGATYEEGDAHKDVPFLFRA